MAVDAMLCLAFATLLRFATLGDPNIHMDEAFYFYVGLEMHQGAIPYVDIWDRKPLGLFILYWIFAGISDSVLAYQIPALFFAAYTAWVLSRIATLFGSRLAGLLAAGCYLALLLPLNGHGGQSPVFYNALIVTAVWLVMQADIRLQQGKVSGRIWIAMVLCGLALTIKQTTLFEGIYLGLWIVFRLWKSGMPLFKLAPLATGLALVGALPFVSIGVWYWAIGHWDRYWFAMVTSNLSRPFFEAAPRQNIPVLFHALGLLIAGAIAGIILGARETQFRKYRPFMIGWLLAAFAGLLSVPLFFGHYALPLLLPLCVCATPAFNRIPVGIVLGLSTIGSAIALTGPVNLEAHRNSRIMFDRMAEAIRANPGSGKLLIYDGPMFLYSLPEVSPMTELAFPWHLVSISEEGTTFIDRRKELERVLREGPDLFLITDEWKAEPYPGALAAIKDHVFGKCELLLTGMRSQRRHAARPVYLYGNCNSEQSPL